MKQTVLRQQGVLITVDVQEDPTLQTDEVLVEVKVVTIYGSNLNYPQAEALPHDLQYPLVLGHEMADIVRETGTAVSSAQKGDRVTVEPQNHYGHCETCQRRDYNLCGSLQSVASKGVSGALE